MYLLTYVCMYVCIQKYVLRRIVREILKRDSRDSFTGLVKSYPSIETNIVINNHLKLSSKTNSCIYKSNAIIECTYTKKLQTIQHQNYF